MNGELYCTADLYLAAFLKARGLRIARTERDGRRVTFVFHDREDRRDLVKEFYNDGTVTVNAYTHAIQDLKAVVHNW